MILWPTEVLYFKNRNIDNDKVKKIILEKERAEPARQVSNMGGWQSHSSLINENGFSEIRNFLFECFSSIKENTYKKNTRASMTAGWANVNRKGNSNSIHAHPNSHWSCVYYVTETYKSSIFFIDPRIRAQMFMPYDLFNEENKYYGQIGPGENEPGDAWFFPAWLEHGVTNNSTSHPRISISCNFIVGIASNVK